jgi:hypothetical protein
MLLQIMPGYGACARSNFPGLAAARGGKFSFYLFMFLFIFSGIDQITICCCAWTGVPCVGRMEGVWTPAFLDTSPTGFM